METLKVKIIGTAPLLMHNNRAADPLSPYAKAMKQVTSKRKKTDDDMEHLSRLEWEAGLYIQDGKVGLPEKCILASIKDGAKKYKKGKDFDAGVRLESNFCFIKYDGPVIDVGETKEIPSPALAEYFMSFRHTDFVKVQRNTVLRTRPIFKGWSCEFTLWYDPKIIDRETVLDSIEIAGARIGIGDHRPRHGRFEYKVLK